MNFSPYHTFASCAKLQSTIEKLHLAGKVPSQIFNNHEKYHYSLLHKLQSARYHVDTLSSFLGSGNAQAQDPPYLVYRVNFHFDGFLQVLGSSMDIFAREVLTYFDEPLPNKVYYHTAYDQLIAKKPTDSLLPFLMKPTWKDEFGDYRNTTTHESLIGTQFSVNFELKGKQSISRIVFPIPDDPRAATRVFSKNKDIVAYCEKTFKRVLSHFNQAYDHIEVRARTSGTFPL